MSPVAPEMYIKGLGVHTAQERADSTFPPRPIVGLDRSEPATSWESEFIFPVMGLVSIDETTQTTMMVRWALPTNDVIASRYNLEMAPALPTAPSLKPRGKGSVKGELMFRSVYTGGELSCRVQDLEPGVAYVFKVQALVDLEHGPFSQVTHASTLPGPPGPLPIPELSGKTKNSLTVKWSEPAATGGSVVLAYELFSDLGNNDLDLEQFGSVYKGPERRFKVGWLTSKLAKKWRETERKRV